MAGEEGVSPGQACVFYDGPEGQARVLGGGFIARAMAQRAIETAAQNGTPAHPLAAELRG